MRRFSSLVLVLENTIQISFGSHIDSWHRDRLDNNPKLFNSALAYPDKNTSQK